MVRRLVGVALDVVILVALLFLVVDDALRRPSYSRRWRERREERR